MLKQADVVISSEIVLISSKVMPWISTFRMIFHVYYLSFSGRTCHGFATIVSPDGTKAAFAWTPPNLPGSNLAYPYGGYETGDDWDLAPPH